MNNKININQIEVESLSQEIKQKSILIARLQANLYKLSQENTELKKQLKIKSKPQNKSKDAK